MKRKISESNQTVFVNVTWDDHIDDCAKCRTVDLNNTSSYVNACAEGSPLLMERAVEIQRPAQQEKARKVKEWAKAAGVFKIPK